MAKTKKTGISLEFWEGVLLGLSMRLHKYRKKSKTEIVAELAKVRIILSDLIKTMAKVAEEK